MSDETPDSQPKIGDARHEGARKAPVQVKRRARRKQARDRLTAYLTHARNCHAKGLTVTQRKEEALKIVATQPHLADTSRETFIYELNLVADPVLGPFIDRLFELASALHETEVELCDAANQPSDKRPRLQIIFVNRLCERALKALGGVSAAIAEFVQELAVAKQRLEAARKCQCELPV